MGRQLMLQCISALKRANGVISGLWLRDGRPHVIGRLQKDGEMTHAGAAGLVLATTLPPRARWTVVPFDGFEMTGDVPAVSDRTNWQATENGSAVPHLIESIPAFRLAEWQEEMSRVHIPNELSDE